MADRDPTTAYAQAVIDGGVVCSRAVRLACQRHLGGVRRQADDDYPYEFVPGAAQHAIDFFPRFLTLEDGEPFVLCDWEQFLTGSIYGWKHKHGKRKRRFRTAYIETAKGSGKTPWIAGIGLYGLVFDEEPAAEIYSAAFDRDQAAIMLRDAIRMASESPDLSDVLEIGKHNIADLSTHSFFRAVSSEHRGRSGPRPHYALIDELHEHRDGMVVEKMRAGFKRREQPLQIEITNAGHDRTSVCWDHHQYSMQVLDGVIEDDSWFAYICHLDPCDQCFEDGYRQPNEGCKHCDDWTDTAVWPKANPSIGVTIQESYLREQVDLALGMPSQQSLTKRLNFCIWTESRVLWIPADRWDACRVPDVSPKNTGMACAMGWDMSEKLDLTAGVVALRVDDDRKSEDVELTDVVDGKEVRKTLNINFSVELIPFFWLPEDTMRERVMNEQIPFNVWRDGGHLRVTPGPVIDHDLIYEQVMKEIVPAYRPQRIGYDPHNATQFAVQMRDKGRQLVAEVQQGRGLSESFKLFEALVRLRRIHHAGNPVLGWCVSNAEPKRDRYENLWLEKPSATKRIDGVIAAVIALSQLVLLPARRRRRMPMIWTPEGFKPIVEPSPGRTVRPSRDGANTGGL